MFFASFFGSIIRLLVAHACDYGPCRHGKCPALWHASTPREASCVCFCLVFFVCFCLFCCFFVSVCCNVVCFWFFLLCVLCVFVVFFVFVFFVFLVTRACTERFLEARKQGSKKERKQGSKKARKQGSKAAREQGSKQAHEPKMTPRWLQNTRSWNPKRPQEDSKMRAREDQGNPKMTQKWKLE